MGMATHMIENQVGSFEVFAWPPVPEWRDRREDKSWVDVLQRPITKATPFKASWGRVLDNDVSTLNQIPEGLSPINRLEVQGHAKFVGVESHIQTAFLQMGNVARKRTYPSRVISFRRLHLNDFCPQMGQDLRAIRSGYTLPHIEHSHSRQKSDCH